MGVPVRSMFTREAVEGEGIVHDTTTLTSGGYSTSADSSSPSTPATSIGTCATSLSIPALVPSPSRVRCDPLTHARDVRTRRCKVSQRWRRFSTGSKKVPHSSGHAAVDVDHVAGKADATRSRSLPRRVRWNTESRGRSNGGAEEHGFGEGKGGDWEKRRKEEDRRFILGFGDEEVADGRETVVNLRYLFCLWGILSLKPK